MGLKGLGFGVSGLGFSGFGFADLGFGFFASCWGLRIGLGVQGFGV